MENVPPSILRALSITDPSKATLLTSGLGSGFTSTGAITANVANTNGAGDEEERKYFVKSSAHGDAAKEMFAGEYESLNAIASAVPGFCPRAIAWGALDDDNGRKKSYFLATEFLDLSARGGDGRGGVGLAQRLGKLHSTPAPVDSQTGKRMFGFPVPTFCGDTKQDNRAHESWADFYANERLLRILKTSEKRNGKDAGLRSLVERTAGEVVPALLGDGHLGYDKNGQGEGITPVVVHGDLWSGNADRGRIVGSGRVEEVGDVVYDPSACYAHSEYELGIMKMFGGFGSAFFNEYHRVVPKTEPVEEYEDRVRLYELMAPEQKKDSRNWPDPDMALPDPPSIHPSFIQVAKPYIFEQTIQKCMTVMGVNPLREETMRLQGVTWIDNVRRALNLYDAAAAALFTACKIEDTLKKSREIICAAYNLKLPQSEHISSDNSVLDEAARGIIGLERLMLESSGFDFRTRHPQKTLIKLARQYGFSPQSEVSNVAYRISQDLYRTFAPIKQTTSTMAFSCLELAGRLLVQRIEDVERGTDYARWKTSREEVMETLLDLLELYTHNRNLTTVGPHFPADRFLTVRIPLNKEAEDHRIPRYTHWTPTPTPISTDEGPRQPPKEPRRHKANGSAKTEKSAPTKEPTKEPEPLYHPLIPATANGERPKPGEKGREAAVRFIVDSEYAANEKDEVKRYFRVEMEEYEVEE
ncbi:Fructosamine kinase-domain-containing protein [Aspergillus undulatus]|uniref:Fructosamine kinase-domain-containing protein n=1 Tax=Aspergillus undulatus TaxID=1810928 RepID=UPI003CCCCBA8